MPRQLGELEDAVMTRVWQWNRPVTVREVLEDLQRERSIAYTTVMTVMDNLHQKGWVRREVDGRAYRYTAVSTRAAYSAALMNEAWSHSDNPAAALVAFFGMMSAEQREALQDAMRIILPDLQDVSAASDHEAPDGRTGAPPEAESGAARDEPAGEPAGEPADVPTGRAGTGRGAEQPGERSGGQSEVPGDEALPGAGR
ncbi:BlaI/MecI/CopY family transcriptional regulator [Streptomyces sp. NPDC014734]|uniref:BlaI/MecI/CopY family transcriptional regulator n=1 Tax=Streptomyces sp. NPDC014734 TaxID=3364886 RepID=UPI0037017A99